MVSLLARFWGLVLQVQAEHNSDTRRTKSTSMIAHLDTLTLLQISPPSHRTRSQHCQQENVSRQTEKWPYAYVWAYVGGQDVCDNSIKAIHPLYLEFHYWRERITCLPKGKTEWRNRTGRLQISSPNAGPSISRCPRGQNGHASRLEERCYSLPCQSEGQRPITFAYVSSYMRKRADSAFRHVLLPCDEAWAAVQKDTGAHFSESRRKHGLDLPKW